MADAIKKEEEGQDLGLHHYRISVVLVGLNNYTIIANSPQEAQEKVMKGEGGLPAGSEGPTDFMALCHDRSVISPGGPPTLQRIMASLQHAVMLQAREAQKNAKPNMIPVGSM